MCLADTVLPAPDSPLKIDLLIKWSNWSDQSINWLVSWLIDWTILSNRFDLDFRFDQIYWSDQSILLIDWKVNDSIDHSLIISINRLIGKIWSIIQFYQLIWSIDRSINQSDRPINTWWWRIDYPYRSACLCTSHLRVQKYAAHFHRVAHLWKFSRTCYNF